MILQRLSGCLEKDSVFMSDKLIPKSGNRSIIKPYRRIAWNNYVQIPTDSLDNLLNYLIPYAFLTLSFILTLSDASAADGFLKT